MQAEEHQRWFHGCHACGQCCDSAPQAALPELMRHQHRLLGELGARRVPRLAAGQRLGRAAVLDEDDVRAHDELSRRIHLPIGAVAGHSEWLYLFTQGFSYASLAACPARGADGRCQLHDEGKPAVCGSVPLEALWPARLQRFALSEREADARRWGADCISPLPRVGLPLFVERAAVVDPASLDALDRRQRSLEQERHHWGQRVAAWLGFDGPNARAVPATGTLDLSITPVLAVVAEASPVCRERVLEYLSAQLQLIEDTLRGALQRKNPADRSDTARLRKHAEAHQALRRRLTDGPHPPARSDAADLERWLRGQAN